MVSRKDEFDWTGFECCRNKNEYFRIHALRSIVLTGACTNKFPNQNWILGLPKITRDIPFYETEIPRMSHSLEKTLQL